MSIVLDKSQLRFYHGWISQQCEFARTAFVELDKKPGVSDKEVMLAFAIINATANLAKMFSPSGAACSILKDYRTARIKTLRELYEITDDNLIMDKTLHNDYEHFDERLDHWTSQHDEGSSEIWNFQGFRYESGDVLVSKTTK